MTANQNAQATDTQHTIQVGFEKALIQMNPEWRTAFSKEQVNQFRAFYHAGIQDMHLLNNLNFQNAQQNFQAVLQTVVVTGNEEEVARLRAEHAARESTQETPVADQVPAKAKGLFPAASKATKVKKATPAKAPAAKAKAKR